MTMNIVRSKTFWVLLAICLLCVMPFLSFDYNTKGEPREAIVAYNMLESGNWIMPRNSVGEIAYKPPLMHWCIAAVSSVTGKVSEFTSRVPSAVAFILLTMATFVFFMRHTDRRTAIFTTILTFTGYELHRMGYNCRVDMMLTAFIVMAMYALYDWNEKGRKGIPITAIIMMSLATLTKGPVGSLLPCLVTGVYMLLRKTSIWKSFLWMMAIGILSLVIPAFWYYMASRQAGSEFITLMMEENVGRMTSTMSYKVHVAPWYINFAYLLMGMAPWTLLAIIALACGKYHKPNRKMPKIAEWPKKVWTWLNSLKPVTLYSLTAVVMVVVFYCIPESKRSVYIMPVFPFLSFLTAKYFIRIASEKTTAINIYTGFLAVVSVLAALIFAILKFVDVPQNIFHGRNSFDTWEMTNNLGTDNSILSWAIMLALAVAGLGWWKWRKKNNTPYRRLMASAILLMIFYLAFDGVIKPAILNAKSVKHIAAKIDKTVAKDDKIYEYIEDAVMAKGDPVHFYELNFYLNDRIGNFHQCKPEKGYLLIGNQDAELRMDEFRKEGYKFEEVLTSGQEPVMKQTLMLYKFQKTSN